ncbi:hypothetical protein [Patulibacter minatonensis]|uniref:hypothetical protein n=1 Tax=Patulibacter minatonensis TaxID=298163 RepID=UPI00047929CF|nr:hypothetical protein [Patulibacter minatonensis]
MTETTDRRSPRKLPRAPAPVLAVLLLLSLGGGDAGAATPDTFDGRTVDGGRLGLSVNGGTYAGSFQARFSDADSNLFYDEEGAAFGLQTDGDAYAARRSGAGGSARPVQQVDAPVLTGTGTAADPWRITSSWRPAAAAGGPDLLVEQTARHVAGRSSVAFTWRVTNRDAAPVPFRAALGADLYVQGSDVGTGVLHDGPPREIGGHAEDGTEAVIVENTPWAHAFTGAYQAAVRPLVNGTALLADAVDPAAVDNGVGVQWADHDVSAPLAPGASATYAATWRFAPPGVAPDAPMVTGGPAEGATSGTTTAFDLSSPVLGTGGRLECSLDGGPWTPCPARHELSGLGEGDHELRVRAFDEEERVGDVTTRRWRVVADRSVPVQQAHDAGPAVVPPAPRDPVSIAVPPVVRTPCASRRTLVSRIPARAGRITRAEVVLGGGEARRLRVDGTRVRIDLRGLASRRYTVKIRLRTREGRTRTITRSFRTCVRPGGGTSAR